MKLLRPLLRLGWPLMLAAALTRGYGAEVATPDKVAELPITLSWGHRSPAGTRFQVSVSATEATLTEQRPEGLEAEDRIGDDGMESRAGGGDVDVWRGRLCFEPRTIQAITNVHSIWSTLLAWSDTETASRLREDPGFRPDRRQLTVRLDADGTRGFSVTVDQLLRTRTFWIPELDVFLAAGDAPVTFDEHQRAIAPYRGQRTLDRLRREPEASHADYSVRWEDMGSPDYRNPHQTGPGHVVGVSWDSTVRKFGIDRGAGLWNDYGNPDRFHVWFEPGDLARLSLRTWRGQSLTDGLPVVVTRFEEDGVRFELEQFAYPLHGPPAARGGDIPMVLVSRVSLENRGPAPKRTVLRLFHNRGESDPPARHWREIGGQGLLTEANATTNAGRVWLACEGRAALRSGTERDRTNVIEAVSELPAHGRRSFVFKLPSPPVTGADVDALIRLDAARARTETLRFWSDQLARGARFEVPEPGVNTLFRANLWHALRLPRRHAASNAFPVIDLPYSNFAYDQTGTPWPVNQSVYVDTLLYDQRGHHAWAAEELAVIYRNNQQSDGRVGGFANWGVYTPGMLYSVAQHYRLSRDRTAFEALLPPTLKALDWCLGELRRAEANPGPASGLVLAPLNDLSHEPRAWAFNQAYFQAGLAALGEALADTGHPRAAECREAAVRLRTKIARAYGRAAVRAPLVPLRDRTWIPFVPGDALTPHRSFDLWYPTDVDTGPLHLARLGALAPDHPLTAYLLHDHEDNLFLHGWGMANEPVYNQHALAWLARDEPAAAIRAFYSMMACAFSHSTFEPVEHRWGWGQYFGPPSTDGAWFDLYRHLLIQEQEDRILQLLPATPRRWLADGGRIRIERAPTFFGPLDLLVTSRSRHGRIDVILNLPATPAPAAIRLRLRHPDARPLRSVRVDGRAWTDFDPATETIRLPHPTPGRHTLNARY